MNGKDLKKLYREHAENTAPDMDALWKRIESGLEEKDVSGVTSKPIKRKISLAKVSAAGAMAAAVLLILPLALRGNSEDIYTENAACSEVQYESHTTTVYEAYDDTADEMYGDPNGGGVYAEDVKDITGAAGGAVYYENLALADTNAQDIVPQGETSGDDFFVEDNVLIQTDVIVNAYVDRVYSRGGTVCYELTAEDAETHKTENITVESETPYVMLENRNYLLPLKNDGGEYSLVFENAPQIELTLDGGMIFHNGWSSLDDGNALEVIYPQGHADDFFYDRMKFSYTADVQSLVDKWRSIKDNGG